MSVFAGRAGARIVADRDRFDDEQARRLRDHLWLRYHEVGVEHPDGKVRRLSVRKIARIFGRSTFTVSYAIRTARAEREALGHVRDDDEQARP